MLICSAIPSQTYFAFTASRLIEIVRIMILIKLFICPVCCFFFFHL